ARPEEAARGRALDREGHARVPRITQWRQRSPRRRRRAPRTQDGVVRIERALLDRIVAHARRDFPNECCGMIGMRAGPAVAVHEATNVAASPLRFEVDGLEVHRTIETIESDGAEMGAMYHAQTRAYSSPPTERVHFDPVG